MNSTSLYILILAIFSVLQFAFLIFLFVYSIAFKKQFAIFLNELQKQNLKIITTKKEFVKYGIPSFQKVNLFFSSFISLSFLILILMSKIFVFFEIEFELWFFVSLPIIFFSVALVTILVSFMLRAQFKEKNNESFNQINLEFSENDFLEEKRIIEETAKNTKKQFKISFI
ncbi:hypothetical protein [Mycoplasmopsis gallinarum]|uniref:hypothetical protein n=1 Tax=Mycoplasmopsis gallinarum TaxID=29557 RepID=UPI0007C48547|nr:hypothetical protein [Mycoplasmopsis gallinarum]